MAWWGRESDAIEHIRSGGPPSGQIRVLVVGDSGVGKTSLVHLILKGSSIAHPRPTVGCAVDVKHISYGGASMSSNSKQGDREGDFFVELWDISGHDRYKDCRYLFYTQIHGVIFVHDLSQRRTKTSLQNWAAEIASTGTFSAPLESGGPRSLPVPCLIIANKADIFSNRRHRSSGNLFDVARMWAEKQGLVPPSEELPLTDSFPGSSSLLAAAKEARYDKEAVMKFFKQLIRRRYFADEQPAPTPCPIPPVIDNQLHSSFRVDQPTLDSQRNYLPHGYCFQRFSEIKPSESDKYEVEIVETM
ncbi:small GTPase LIP1-like isoform X2 [Phalaenopsis equestris]|uniref:small GTPase LIP1-like isoform X2 n=1 Tax=Phalaenopsis equestris TaxID=78828 RepID=UPI0009E50205|nr:small GTPase LIP1-like isoform X2 [Phalaenopsis equestris]